MLRKASKPLAVLLMAVTLFSVGRSTANKEPVKHIPCVVAEYVYNEEK